MHFSYSISRHQNGNCPEVVQTLQFVTEIFEEVHYETVQHMIEALYYIRHCNNSHFNLFTTYSHIVNSLMIVTTKNLTQLQVIKRLRFDRTLSSHVILVLTPNWSCNIEKQQSKNTQINSKGSLQSHCMVTLFRLSPWFLRQLKNIFSLAYYKQII